MPLFYFILKTGRESFADPEGEEFSGEAEARVHATAVAKQLMSHRESGTRSWRIEIRDDYLLPVSEISFADVDETIREFSANTQFTLKCAARLTAARQQAFAEVLVTFQELNETLALADRILSSLARGARL